MKKSKNSKAKKSPRQIVRLITYLDTLSLKEVLKNCIHVISDPKEYPSYRKGKGTCLNIVRQSTQSALKRSYTIANTMNKVKKKYTIKDIIIDELAEYSGENKSGCMFHLTNDLGLKSEDLYSRKKDREKL